MLLLTLWKSMTPSIRFPLLRDTRSLSLWPQFFYSTATTIPLAHWGSTARSRHKRPWLLDSIQWLDHSGGVMLRFFLFSLLFAMIPFTPFFHISFTQSREHFSLFVFPFVLYLFHHEATSWLASWLASFLLSLISLIYDSFPYLWLMFTSWSSYEYLFYLYIKTPK